LGTLLLDEMLTNLIRASSTFDIKTPILQLSSSEHEICIRKTWRFVPSFRCLCTSWVCPPSLESSMACFYLSSEFSYSSQYCTKEFCLPISATVGLVVMISAQMRSVFAVFLDVTFSWS